MPACPVSSLDPFADDFLAAPYPFYAELRQAGPLVRLERYGLWACARHAEVQAALSDWQTFSSAAGVGIDDFRRTKPWRPPSLIPRSRSATAYAQPYGDESSAVGKADGGPARRFQGSGRETRG